MISAFVAASSWAFTGIFVRMLSGMTAWEITGWRLLVALVGVAPFLALALGRRAWSVLARTVGMRMSWLLAFLMLAYYLTAVLAFSRAPIADVVLLINIAPLYVILTNLVRGRGARPAELVGVLVAFVGVVAILAPSLPVSRDVDDATLFGYLCAILAAVVRGSYSLLYREAEQQGRAPDVSIVVVMTFASGIVLIVICGGTGPSSSSDLLNLALLGLLSTALPTWTNAYASRRLPATVATAFGLLTPVIAGVAAAAFLGEIPSAWVFLGGVLVLAGLAVLTRGP